MVVNWSLNSAQLSSMSSNVLTSLSPPHVITYLYVDVNTSTDFKIITQNTYNFRQPSLSYKPRAFRARHFRECKKVIFAAMNILRYEHIASPYTRMQSF